MQLETCKKTHCKQQLPTCKQIDINYHHANKQTNNKYLVGSIPRDIEGMLSLTSMYFSYKNLSSLVISINHGTQFDATSFIGNRKLYGPYLGPCKDLSSLVQTYITCHLFQISRCLQSHGFLFDPWPLQLLLLLRKGH